MAPRPFHLAWFCTFRPPVWTSPYGEVDGRTWPTGDFHVDMARSLERACFDYIMMEDSTLVSDTFGGTMENDLQYSIHAPKHDPLVLAPLMAQATSRLGVVVTMSTSFYHPYLVARSMSTLDHLTRGRIGWNIVTSSEDVAAQNYGMDRLPEHDERYDRADEFVEIVTELWDSWDDDALVMDRAERRYVDHNKVRTIDYVGKYLKCRGPLNTLRGPQGRPVICQAGGSPRGRAFAAQHADIILAAPLGVEAMKAYRDEIQGLAEDHGRPPGSCKVMFLVSPILGATEEEAAEKRAEIYSGSDERVADRLAHLAVICSIDWTKYDWDEPIPDDLTTNGHQSVLDNFRRHANGRTIREAAADSRVQAVELVGTSESVADQMAAVMDEVGGDGFLFTGELSREYIRQVTDGLVPALQRRGVVRTSYAAEKFRDNVLSF
ncbi:MAG: NtaA/DmoA family FMN-dependent monooxygenase [Acidimicrobiia bacterium]